MENLAIDPSKYTAFNHIINPFSPIILCDHYVGNEIDSYLHHPIYGPELSSYKSFIQSIKKNNILKNNNLHTIQDYDIIYVEVKWFDAFVVNILPKINKKIVLITGQFIWPQVYLSKNTDFILNHPNILLWISQNPIYPNSAKYMAFPYGIAHYNLEKYGSALLKYDNNSNKSPNVINLPMSNGTNPCRSKFPVLPSMEVGEFYKKISDSKFALSPIGDRDDCYRHYECIGLGTVPISNVGSHYRAIFGENMYYCDIDTMVGILDNGIIDCSYAMPNRDLICFDYYKDIVMIRISELKQQYGQGSQIPTTKSIGRINPHFKLKFT
jgi:hypothetical protein